MNTAFESLDCHGEKETLEGVTYIRPMTQREVGEALGLAHTTVSKIEMSALKKIKANLERLGLKPEDLFR